ncbi:MAG: methionine synthase [Limnochordales bacterium]|nr:methionine synthase [Limnochordales bacterium]
MLREGRTRPARERRQLLRQLLAERVLVLDGAMGTEIQRRGLSAADFGGPLYEGCNEVLVLTRPEVIRDIHRSYLEAGADIIETNTFGSTRVVLAEYGLADRAFEITRAAAALAREVADEYTRRTPSKPRFVAGSMGPTTRAISVTGGVTFDELVDNYYEQARALVAGGVDYLLLETGQDTRNIKAGLIAIDRLNRELSEAVPVAVSVTIEPSGTMLAGQTVEALVTSLEHADLLYIGLNCATGPDLMTDHLRAMAGLARFPVACVPNAGLPDEEGRYPLTPEMMARTMDRFLDEGWVNVIGGCCGTTPAHIQALVELVNSRPRPPRRPPADVLARTRTFVSGLENLEIEESNRPVLVGERTNVVGSRQFRDLIAAGKFAEASEIARRQVRAGAQVIDICLANPDRDEGADMEAFLAEVIKKVKVPLMIDSTNPRVIERALTYCQGKAIINSVNLEDGEQRFREVVPLARRFGAALVVGCIDEQGMAVTCERKLAIARRSYELLVEKYGVAPSDIIFDPLTFPAAAGDREYAGSARETVEAIRRLKQEFPHCKTILGISNVSFGLPPAGREVVNSVFLYHATQAGLDLAIVNPEKLYRYAGIPEKERQLAEAVLFSPPAESEAAVAAFVAYFRERTAHPVSGGRRHPASSSAADLSALSVDERLARYIVEGTKEGLLEDLDHKLKEGATPLEIINGPLMAGMDEVGRLFKNNQLIVAEVLQSAEVMKAAVAYLEQFMESDGAAVKGKVLLATVKGDVHDIGKNLVHIILSNNGYQVIDLGTKVAPGELIAAIRTHRPDIVGLSGLLVKSAEQMVVTARELARAGIDIPLLVGGAALTNGFVRKRIAPEYPGLVAYAADAMQGLELANQIISKEGRQQLARRLQEEDLAARSAAPAASRGAAEEGTAATPTATPAGAPISSSRPVPILETVPEPPDLQRHVLHQIDPDEVWPFINPVMLYNRHLGLRINFGKARAAGDARAAELERLIEEIKEECRRGLMQVSAVWQFFPAASEKETIHLYEPGTDRIIATLTFPRQPGAGGLCLADYIRPSDAAPRDTICLLAVTAGKGIARVAAEWREKGELLRSHALQALALETAEATCEWLHSKIRAWWGFPDPPGMTMKDRFQAKYRGRRYSFGYPACPDLAQQQVLFRLLRPEEIGIQLTDGFMMDPEASVSAMVFHHPACRYFDARVSSDDGEK